MSNLAFVLDAKGDRQGAIQLLRESLEMSRRELGPEHPDVAGGATNLAYWLISTGEYDEAARLLDEASPSVARRSATSTRRSRAR